MMRARSFGRLPREERGAALVEAALVLPMLLMLTFGIWTTARAWNVHNVLDHAAREAARYAATTPDSLAVLDPIARGEILAASIPWSDISGCSSIIESGTPLESATAGAGITVPDTSPAVCISLGQAPGEDPTTDDRAQIRLTMQDYRLDFILFSLEVDLTAQAVSRLEP
ncbi:MAG: pilus assembly protein [Acidimicrobiia bacterium]|nr:pilus assembly protein [Acidimicrobiia bacterium]MDH3398121.1 pilus assembly protein [Acidimicrobiia bacterium]